MGLNKNFGKIELKSEKGELYGEGFVSTIDPDLYDDVVLEKAQNSMLKQFKDRSIKFDFDHDKFRDPTSGKVYDEPKNLIPPAKVVEAERRTTPDGSLGTWVKVQFNKHHSRFTELKNSIKDGFIDAFSIGYSVIKATPFTKDGKTYRGIEDLTLYNIAFTGDAVNTKCKLRLALKSFPKIKMEKTIEDYKTELLELKSEHKDALEKVQAELKAKDELNKKLSDKEKALLEKKAKDDESSKKDKTEMKSLTDKKDKDFLELKSKFDKSEVSVTELKSKVDELEAQPQLKDIKMFQKEYKSQMFDENNKPQLERFNI